MKSGLLIIGVIALILALIILMPFVAIWAINTVFLTSYALNSVWQWLAMAGNAYPAGNGGRLGGSESLTP